MNRMKAWMFLLLGLQCISCNGTSAELPGTESENSGRIIVGAERFDRYLKILKDKNIGLVVNQTSLVGETPLVDSLLKLNVSVKKIFTPEHGFRGTADAGEKVKSSRDEKTGLPIISLYGSKKKPAPEDIQDLDVLVFDLQDVGARFYTYISTLHYVMEACAENGKPLIILDRPNPNGFYVDGPVLDTAFRSFVGMHPVPIVHGMTVGEYASMLNGEMWLKAGTQCELTVVPCLNYDHAALYNVRVKPSPNLPNMTAIYLYPSLCLFEGTAVSIGRGTDKPFQLIGYPEFDNQSFSFIPQSREGAQDPPYKGVTCYGIDLSNLPQKHFQQKKSLDLSWLIDMYRKYPDKKKFFTPFFQKLAGTAELQRQIESGKTEEEIRYSWQPALEKFKSLRKKYLLYKDF
ncbi:MAG TPA: DUF1343 domain-containing protein [Chitinophagales bacterium]|nr:DUF1343 domain-containing protein [Chitinophagales bacterium]